MYNKRLDSYKQEVFKELDISFSGVISIFNRIATLIYTEIISRFSQPDESEDERKDELQRIFRTISRGECSMTRSAARSDEAT